VGRSIPNTNIEKGGKERMKKSPLKKIKPGYHNDYLAVMELICTGCGSCDMCAPGLTQWHGSSAYHY